MDDEIDIPIKEALFDLYLSGEKKEEYLKPTDKWIRRLFLVRDGQTGQMRQMSEIESQVFACKPDDLTQWQENGLLVPVIFHTAVFRTKHNRRTQKRMVLVPAKLDKGQKEWGAPDEQVLVLRIGDKVE